MVGTRRDRDGNRVRRCGARLACTLLGLAAPALADLSYQQTNLVSDIPGLAATTDPNLLNPWGIALSSTGPFWIANNHTGTSTVYNGAGQPFPVGSPLLVTIPTSGGGTPPGAPTGTAFYGGSDFVVGSGPARFIFVGEDGVISGWNQAAGAAAIRMVDRSGDGSVYKGVTLASVTGGSRLYATDFANGRVDMYDGSFQPVSMPGAFTDPSLPAGYAPFNIQNIGGQLYVAYAQPGNDGDELHGAGLGIVDVYNTDGGLVSRFATGGALNAPWGFALAPGNFGPFSNTLLVGNVGDGRINAFDPVTGSFLGTLADANGNALQNDELWSLTFGNGGNGGLTNTLYFTAGINGEADGLFGSIQVVPEPATSVLVLGLALGLLGRRHRW